MRNMLGTEEARATAAVALLRSVASDSPICDGISAMVICDEVDCVV